MDPITLSISLLKTLVIIFGVVLPLVSLTVYAERKISAFIQDRVGPNRVGVPLGGTTFFGVAVPNFGLAGLGQLVTDPMKFILKEDLTPGHVNQLYYWLAPGLAMVPALLSLAVLPFGSAIPLDPILGLFGFSSASLGLASNTLPLVIANINVGVVYIFAITSLSVYGIVIAGWASNSKYPFLGGVRSSSQMIAYELSMGLSVVPIFLIASTLNLGDIVQYQREHGWFIFPFTDGQTSLQEILLWPFMLVSMIIFMVSIFAETNRTPFDLPECEQELVAGYHTEYSSMKFALFFLGEYAAMIAASGLITTLFWGGWALPFGGDGSAPGWAGVFWGIINVLTFFAKVSVMLFIFMWVRWTVPRFRFDQLMRLGWVYFFEIATINIVIIAAILAFVPKA